MREESHRDQAHRLDSSLSAAADVLASVGPCPFAPGKPLDGSGHYDNRSPRCRARGKHRRKARPFIVEMMEFVEARRAKEPAPSWEKLRHEWNPGHELHRYGSADSMREAYSNAVRRHAAGNPAHEICRQCVLEHLRDQGRSRSRSGKPE